MKYLVRHHSKIVYRNAVADAQINLRLKPVDWPGQTITDYRLDTYPSPSRRRSRAGAYLVNVASLSFDGKLSTLEVTSTFGVEVNPPPTVKSVSTVREIREEALALRTVDAHSPSPYLFASRIADLDSVITAWASQYFSQEDALFEGVQAFNAAIHRDFIYKSGVSSSRTSPAEVFESRSGVCQDFTHLMISALRGLGVPAAYVSGYLRTLPPEGGERLVGADAMHAWVAVWCGKELGWVGFDPTNDCLARESHIVVAMGRDYADISPIDGVFVGSPRQQMDLSVDVISLD